MTDALPRKEDFVVYGDLDELAAYQDFGGKTVEEVRTMLQDNFIRYQEHFLFMGPVAFCFYVDSLINYVASLSCGHDHLDDYDDLRAVESLLEAKLQDQNVDRLRPCAARAASCLDCIAAQMEHADIRRSRIARRSADAYRKLALA